MIATTAIVFLSTYGTFWAHLEGPSAGPRGWNELIFAWTLDPLLLAGLALTAWAYRRGSRRLWSRGRGLRRWEAGCFWAGWGSLAFATVSPLHAWGQVLFSAHMTQHEVLMLVAAPLLILGRAGMVFLAALPAADAGNASRWIRSRLAQPGWRALFHPLGAWALHALVLWVWHTPRLYESALRYEFVHDLQHASFFLSALAFWWALLRGRASWFGGGAAALYLFTTMLHSGLLGALITFSDQLIYTPYAQTTLDWKLTPIEDQQLGGLIMWVPAALIYLGAALALLAGWISRVERRLEEQERGVEKAAARVVGLLIVVLISTGCGGRRESEAIAATGGDPQQGRRLVRELGCAACHTIPGVAGADARVGPSLAGIARQSYLAGTLPNRPEVLIQWLLDPAAHNPGTIMPTIGLSPEQARDIAAYLYTLRD